MPYTPLMSEVLDKVAKAKTKKQKVELLRQHNTDALRMVLKSSFDPRIEWELPEGDVPYTPNDAPEGTEHNMLVHEARTLYHYIKGGNPQLTQNRRENMFIQLLEGLHQDEAEIIVSAKDKGLHRKYKGLSSNVVREAFGWTEDYMQPEPTEILEGHEPQF
tara:strand:+ start:513 stop:995 length:483 start_codon:yes stop_codon:yes gene_type:complete